MARTMPSRSPANTVTVRTRWANEELGAAKLGDARSIQRAILVLTALAAQVVGAV